MINFR